MPCFDCQPSCKRFERASARIYPPVVKHVAISEKAARHFADHLKAALAPATKPPLRQRYLRRILEIQFVVDT